MILLTALLVASIDAHFACYNLHVFNVGQFSGVPPAEAAQQSTTSGHVVEPVILYVEHYRPR